VNTVVEHLKLLKFSKVIVFIFGTWHEQTAVHKWLLVVVILVIMTNFQSSHISINP